ncbi:MAG: hypothetical protein GC154_17120 [bacterium]|nr:hypothetical protein [bacterium]
MTRRLPTMVFVCLVLLSTGFVCAQDAVNFNEKTDGPWSDVANTTITIPKVSSVQLDASVSSAEYGGFTGINVIPAETGWVLNYAAAKNFEGPDDTSFTWYMAYDDNNLYIGLTVKDDVVRSNDPPASFWKDDSVELVIGPYNDRYSINTDDQTQAYDVGGHVYFNYQGVISADRAAGDVKFSNGVQWVYGENGDVFAVGKETPGGWTLEARIGKSMLNLNGNGLDMKQGSVFDFDIGLDDDDGADLALQYWWASRWYVANFFPANENFELLTDEEIATRAYLDPDSDAFGLLGDLTMSQPLRYSQTGEVKLGAPGASVTDWSLR